MIFNELNEENFLLFAIKHYENPLSSTREEFEEDLKRFKYVKRWLKKYHDTGDMNYHLALNHIIIIFNCWDVAAIPMLFYKIDNSYWSCLKTILIYLNSIPEFPHTDLHSIPTDDTMINKLKGI
jgi:hypothetical protein